MCFSKFFIFNVLTEGYRARFYLIILLLLYCKIYVLKIGVRQKKKKKAVIVFFDCGIAIFHEKKRKKKYVCITVFYFLFVFCSSIASWILPVNYAFDVSYKICTPSILRDG